MLAQSNQTKNLIFMLIDKVNKKFNLHSLKADFTITFQPIGSWECCWVHAWSFQTVVFLQPKYYPHYSNIVLMSKDLFCHQVYYDDQDINTGLLFRTLYPVANNQKSIYSRASCWILGVGTVHTHNIAIIV